MSETVTGPDGKAISLPPIGDDFARMQAEQIREASKEVPAPPPKDYGTKADGTPKKTAGRPRKDADAPRVQSAPPSAKADPVGDYTRQIGELTEALWFGLAQVPIAPIQAQAAILKHHQSSLVHGWNLAAQNNGTIRGALEKTESVSWVMALAMCTAPFAMQTYAMWTKSPEDLAARGMPTMDELAASTARDMENLAQAQAQAMAAATAAA